MISPHGIVKGTRLTGHSPLVPVQLHYQLAILKTLHSNAASVHRNSAYRWGWGDSGSYISALGYIALQPKKDRLSTPALWKQVWSTNGLPKVNFFLWTLMQNKQLTGDNLSKRNIVGPHSCAMCRNSEETVSHMFIDCDFTKEVWKLTLLGLHASPPQHSSVADLFTEWFQCYPHNIPNNPLWFHIWISIPKFLCWEIWLTRNDRIFNNSWATNSTMLFSTSLWKG